MWSLFCYQPPEVQSVTVFQQLKCSHCNLTLPDVGSIEFTSSQCCFHLGSLRDWSWHEPSPFWTNQRQLQVGSWRERVWRHRGTCLAGLCSFSLIIMTAIPYKSWCYYVTLLGLSDLPDALETASWTYTFTLSAYGQTDNVEERECMQVISLANDMLTKLLSNVSWNSICQNKY